MPRNGPFQSHATPTRKATPGKAPSRTQSKARAPRKDDGVNWPALAETFNAAIEEFIENNGPVYLATQTPSINLPALLSIPEEKWRTRIFYKDEQFALVSVRVARSGGLLFRLEPAGAFADQEWQAREGLKGVEVGYEGGVKVFGPDFADFYREIMTMSWEDSIKVISGGKVDPAAERAQREQEEALAREPKLEEMEDFGIW